MKFISLCQTSEPFAPRWLGAIGDQRLIARVLCVSAGPISSGMNCVSRGTLSDSLCVVLLYFGVLVRMAVSVL